MGGIIVQERPFFVEYEYSILELREGLEHPPQMCFDFTCIATDNGLFGKCGSDGMRCPQPFIKEGFNPMCGYFGLSIQTFEDGLLERLFLIIQQK